MNKLYINYQTRLITLIVSTIILILISSYLLLDSFNLFDKTKVSYNEENIMNYSVLYKDNNIFSEKEMSSNEHYIANLIDKVKINYSYLLNTEEFIKGTYNYNLTATLNIVDQVTGELYYDKDYVLVDSITEHILKSKLTINNNTEIDYNYFNNEASKLLPYYGTNAKANLKVSFNVLKDMNNTIYKENYMNDPISSHLIIPLTNEETNIKFISENNTLDKTLNIITEYDEKDDNYLYYSIILDVVIIYFIFKIYKLLTALKVKENKYDKKLLYIKRKYNKIIVDVETQIDFAEYKTTKISKFNELLDVRNSYKEPIRFYEVTPHNKCHFYIIHKNELFIYTLKNVDLEK